MSDNNEQKDLEIKSDVRAGLDLSGITKPFEDLANQVGDAVNNILGRN